MRTERSASSENFIRRLDLGLQGNAKLRGERFLEGLMELLYRAIGIHSRGPELSPHLYQKFRGCRFFPHMFRQTALNKSCRLAVCSHTLKRLGISAHPEK